MIAFARYWIASIVCPCLPISTPRSRPENAAVSVSSSSSIVSLACTPISRTIRTRSSRTVGASSLSSTASAAASPSSFAATVAITRAGAKPTPSRPRSPSETTWNLTADLSSPGWSFSSSRSADHFASPTVSPVASIWSSPLSPITAVACATRAAFSSCPFSGETGRVALSSMGSLLALDLPRLRRSGGAGRCGLLRGPVSGRLFFRRCPRRAALRLGRRGLLRQLARHQTLADGPEVRRHPVDDQPHREPEQERNEEDRQHHHQVTLGLVHRRGHEVRRGDLARRVDDEQQVTGPVRVRMRGDVGNDVQPRQRPRRRMLRERAQHEVEREEDR